MLTLDELERALPLNVKSAASQALADKINQASQDPEAARVIRKNFVSYTSVLAQGRFKIEDYLNAVSYVSFKLMGHSNQEAYKRAFPDRYKSMTAEGKSTKTISAYVAHYNKNKLVNLVLEQTIIPTWVLNQDIYQEAINTQFKLMKTAKSEKVQCDAANSILTHLKQPDTKTVQVDLGIGRHTGLETLKASMAALAQQQLDLIKQGMSTSDVVAQKLVWVDDGEADDTKDVINDPSVE